MNVEELAKTALCQEFFATLNEHQSSVIKDIASSKNPLESAMGTLLKDQKETIDSFKTIAN